MNNDMNTIISMITRSQFDYVSTSRFSSVNSLSLKNVGFMFYDEVFYDLRYVVTNKI